MISKGQILNKRNKLVFSRWSRKSWAVFCSLGREVKIAVLKLVVADGFIKKNKVGIIVSEATENENKDSGDSSEVFKLNSASPLAFLLNLIQPQKNVVCGGQYSLTSEYFIIHNKLHPFLSGKDFLFLLQESLKSKNIKQITLLSC
jgi:hypothetical protein